MNEDEFKAWGDIRDIRAALQQHIKDEDGILNQIKEDIHGHVELMKELGTAEQIRARVTFVELLLEREKVKVKLHRAIIEKSLLGAVWAVVVFLIVASFNELRRHFTGGL
jgi:hypothetical protein